MVLFELINSLWDVPQSADCDNFHQIADESRSAIYFCFDTSHGTYEDEHDERREQLHHEGKHG